MDVPPHIRPFQNGDYDDPPAASTVNGFVDPMIVPDRILVAGGRAIIGEKQPPPEIALDLHTLPPVRYSQKVLETPPAKLTLQDRSFPYVMDDVEIPAFRLRRNSIGSHAKVDPPTDRSKNSATPTKPALADGLPSSSTLSLLTPADELMLLRNHVRKLTSRVIKLEENVQDLNTHVGWIEGVGGALLALMILKSLKGLFWGS